MTNRPVTESRNYRKDTYLRNANSVRSAASGASTLAFRDDATDPRDTVRSSGSRPFSQITNSFTTGDDDDDDSGSIKRHARSNCTNKSTNQVWQLIFDRRYPYLLSIP